MLSSNDLNNILATIDKHFLLFVGKTMGEDELSASERETLRKYGIDYHSLYDQGKDVATINFQLGMLSNILSKSQMEKFTYKSLETYIKSGNFIPLNETERSVIQSIKMQSLADIRATKGRIFSDINNVVNNQFSTERANQEEFIRERIEEGVRQRKGRRDIAREISKLTGDWGRNFTKSVAYISHTAYNEGRAAMIGKRYGGEAKVWFLVQPDACVACQKAYLKGKEPIIFPLSEIIANGTNIGRKQADWLPVLGAMHPHCFDRDTDVLTSDGWKPWPKVTGLELFLSVDIKTGQAEWVPAVGLVKYLYNGKMNHYKNVRFNLMTTPKHNHVGRVRGGDLEITDKPASHFKFLKSIPNWQGVCVERVNVGGYSFDGMDFMELMGWWLSEGSVSENKGRFELKITQHKQHNYDNILSCVVRCFGEHVWAGKEAIYVKISRDLYDYFKLFGHSGDKFVPDLIKNANSDFLRVFFDAYVAGDGHVRPGKIWKGSKFSPSVTVSTSSERVASDLSEIILKLGMVPSFEIRKPKEISFKNGKYTAKKPQTVISVNTLQYSSIETMGVIDVDYNDYVYDVELARNNTLFVRRGGKVALSGNCRCSVQEHIPPAPAEEVKRPKIRVFINGEERWV